MSRLSPFRPATDAAAAAWVTNNIHGFAHSVVSIIPTGFAAYARIYHPAWRMINDTCTPVRWSELALANHRVAHRQMQWPHIVGRYPGMSSPGSASAPHESVEEPSEGSVPPDVSRPLWQTLAPHTTTPKDCWFAVWEGWGCLSARIRSAPSFAIPNRQFHLFHGSIEAIKASFCEPPVHHQSANLWWPNDRAWYVTTEIDFMTTYVAGTPAAIAALMTCTALEVDTVEPTDGVTWASDTINPPPTQSWT